MIWGLYLVIEIGEASHRPVHEFGDTHSLVDRLEAAGNTLGNVTRVVPWTLEVGGGKLFVQSKRDL